MKTLALVGCAHIHTPGFIRNIKARADLRVKSVWDHDLVRAGKCAGELSAGVVDDYRAIFADREIEGVIVCSETDRHEQLVIPAVNAGKHLFVEKPLGMGAADSLVMSKAIEKAGVLFQTGYFSRGDPKNLFLKQQVELGNFGKITRIRGSNCHAGALGRWFDTDYRWMANPKIAGVGAFGDLGTHSLDIMLWLMGDVSAVTAQLDVGTGAYEGCDETGEGLLRFNNGAIGTLAAGWDDVANPVRFIISGTTGHAVIMNDQVFYKTSRDAQFDGTKPVPTGEMPASEAAGLDAFFNALAGNADAKLVTAREAAYLCSVMEAMYEGAQQQKWVKPR